MEHWNRCYRCCSTRDEMKDVAVMKHKMRLNINFLTYYCLFSCLYANVHNEVNNGYLRFCDIFNFAYIHALHRTVFRAMFHVYLQCSWKCIAINVSSFGFYRFGCQFSRVASRSSQQPLFSNEKLCYWRNRIPGDLNEFMQWKSAHAGRFALLPFASINRQNMCTRFAQKLDTAKQVHDSIYFRWVLLNKKSNTLGVHGGRCDSFAISTTLKTSKHRNYLHLIMNIPFKHMQTNTDHLN